MDIKQQHGIKVGDLVRFKHHIFDEHQPVHLVIEITGSIASVSEDGIGPETHYVRIASSMMESW